MKGSRAVHKLVALAALSLLGGPAFAQTPFKFAGVQSERLPVKRIAPRSLSTAGANLGRAATCDRTLQLLMGVLGAHEPVDVRTDLRLAEIEELASRVGHRGKHKPLGSYHSKFSHTIDVDITDAVGRACTGVVRLRVEMTLTERRIQIGRELAEEPCLFSAVLDHYGRHAAFDDNALRQFVQWATVALNRSPTPPLQENAQSVEEDRRRVAEFAKKIVEQGLPTLDAERNSSAETVDTPAEIQKLAEGCSTHA